MYLGVFGNCWFALFGVFTVVYAVYRIPLMLPQARRSILVFRWVQHKQAVLFALDLPSTGKPLKAKYQTMNPGTERPPNLCLQTRPRSYLGCHDRVGSHIPVATLKFFVSSLGFFSSLDLGFGSRDIAELHWQIVPCSSRYRRVKGVTVHGPELSPCSTA